MTPKFNMLSREVKDEEFKLIDFQEENQQLKIKELTNDYLDQLLKIVEVGKLKPVL